MRPVTVLAAGGTIAMRGEQAVPVSGVEALVEQALGGMRPPGLELRDLMNLPGPHIGVGEALAIAREARACAEHGRGVVVTCGTDTMEELAMLTDLLYGGEEPIVFTGANRPGSSRGADGPANLADAIAFAAAPLAAASGVTIVFAGEIHAARTAVKLEATGPAAFGSPQSGPLGRIVGGAAWLASRPLRQPVLDPKHLDARVEIVAAYLGSEGRLLDGAAAVSDGVVVVVLGAGHVPPAFLEALRRACAALPVVVTTRVPRGGMLLDSYGFSGAERDVRASGAVPAGMLAAPAARIKLLACLGAELDRDAIARAFAGDDAHPL